MNKQIGNYEFYSKENMMLIIDIFSDYMREKHAIQLDSIDDTKAIKKHVYATMNDVYDANKGKNKASQELNVIVLTSLREFYIQKAKTAALSKPNVANLNRDAQLFGARPIKINELIPEGNPYSKKETELSPLALDKLLNERDRQVNPQITKPDISKLGQQIRENPEDSSSFLKRLDVLQNERNKFNVVSPPINEQSSAEIMAAIKGEMPFGQDTIMNRLVIDNETQQQNNLADHKVMFSTPISTNLLGSGESKPFNPSENSQDTISVPLESGQSFLNPRNIKTKEVKKYLSINSADRSWELEPLRYKYSVNALGNDNDFQNRYRNIESIGVGKVIIPEEIIEKVTTTNQNMKQFFNYDFSFAYPYLMLRIDEFNDVYDGTNDNVRKAFCKLIYHRSYKAPNGRGYIILEPIQKEKKKFYPTPLSSFQKLSISLLKPNGDLLNTSSDSYKLFKVEYEQFNTHYFKIVSDVYFDKNEFFVGDEIIIQGHAMTVLTNNMTELQVKRFNDFINRSEGHEIKQIGSANDSGFFRTFYIQAPGSFDRTVGQYTLDTDMINTLNEYNTQIDFCDPQTPSNGRILNNSLQHTISLQMEMLIDDARIIDREIL